MSAPKLPTNQKNLNKKLITKMASWLRNQIANLYNGVSAPVVATRDVLGERL